MTVNITYFTVKNMYSNLTYVDARLWVPTAYVKQSLNEGPLTSYYGLGFGFLGAILFGMLIFLGYACGLTQWVILKYNAWRGKLPVVVPQDDTSRIVI